VCVSDIDLPRQVWPQGGSKKRRPLDDGKEAKGVSCVSAMIGRYQTNSPTKLGRGEDGEDRRLLSRKIEICKQRACQLEGQKTKIPLSGYP